MESDTVSTPLLLSEVESMHGAELQDAGLGVTELADVTRSAGGGGRRMIVRGGLWSAASQLIPSVGTAALSVVAARALGSDALGRQSLIAFVNMAIAAVLVTSLSFASLRVMGSLDGKGEVAKLRAMGSWVIRAHVAAGLAVCSLVLVIGVFRHRDLLAWGLIGVVSIADAAVSGISIRVVIREGWAPISQRQLIFQMFGPPLGILGVYLGFGIPGIFAGDGIAAVGMLIAMIVRYRRRAGDAPVRRVHVRLRPPAPIMRVWGLFAVVELITQVVSRRIEFVVLAVLSTSRQIATYSVAFMVVSIAAMVPFAVAGAALPLVAAAEGSGDIGRATKHLRYAVRVGSLISFPLVALVAVLGPTSIQLVYGSRYDEAARLVPFAALSLLVSVIAGVCGQYWSGLGRMKIIIVTGAIAAIVDVGTATALVPAYGATGAVVGNLTGQVALAVGLMAVTVRRLGSFQWQLRGLASMAAASAVGAGAAVGVIVGMNAAFPHDATLRGVSGFLLGGVAGTVALLFAATLLKVFSEDEAVWLAPIVPQRVVFVLRALTRRTRRRSRRNRRPQPRHRLGHSPTA